ncbi:hypothetical protein GZH47_13405 [Paenibacillus rhizovicinus]|uniref:DUF1453 domain-containing protein n=1 Tax=Paenibacillus rhizovicinus TaxID=2704463 RepID=A0A6C0P0J1_9BACL|nr:hypothetical protein [Paenibacillus rhizovicinus]QHW31736.1 hypothetical protein GZH47_13405 [Paenibacillus rhizovicinus]
MQQQIIIILVVCLVGYRIMKRVKSNFTWTVLKTRSLRIRMILFAVIGVVFLAEGGVSAAGIVSDVIGILIGVALGYIGSEMTSFEQRGTELYYRANVWIGSLVTALFIGRFAYRFYTMFEAGQDGGWQNMSPASSGSSWTSGLMLIMFAYYIVYYFLLMRHRGQSAGRVY